MIPTLTTPRLLMRPLELADAAQAQVLFPRWEIVRYMTAAVSWPYPPDGAFMYYRDVALPAMERGEAWDWSLRLHEAPDKLVGAMTLRRSEADNRGFWIGLPWQRCGLATEACAAANAFWFEVLGFPALCVGKAAANEPSRRISMREGMRLVGTEERDYVSGRLTAETWELTADEWRARRAGRTATTNEKACNRPRAGVLTSAVQYYAGVTTTDTSRLEATLDYGNSSGYFVRVDVDLPPDALYPRTMDGMTRGWLGLSPDEADALAASLADLARRAREAAHPPKST